MDIEGRGADMLPKADALPLSRWQSYRYEVMQTTIHALKGASERPWDLCRLTESARNRAERNGPTNKSQGRIASVAHTYQRQSISGPVS